MKKQKDTYPTNNLFNLPSWLHVFRKLWWTKYIPEDDFDVHGAHQNRARWCSFWVSCPNKYSRDMPPPCPTRFFGLKVCIFRGECLNCVMTLYFSWLIQLKHSTIVFYVFIVNLYFFNSSIWESHPNVYRILDKMIFHIKRRHNFCWMWTTLWYSWAPYEQHGKHFTPNLLLL